MTAPVTLGHIRGHGCPSLLVYCGSIHCSHSAEWRPDDLPDDLKLRTLDPRMRCTRCGHRGADVRPDWRPMVERSRKMPWQPR